MYFFTTWANPEKIYTSALRFLTQNSAEYSYFLPFPSNILSNNGLVSKREIYPDPRGQLKILVQTATYSFQLLRISRFDSEIIITMLKGLYDFYFMKRLCILTTFLGFRIIFFMFDSGYWLFYIYINFPSNSSPKTNLPHKVIFNSVIQDSIMELYLISSSSPPLHGDLIFI